MLLSATLWEDLFIGVWGSASSRPYLDIILNYYSHLAHFQLIPQLLKLVVVLTISTCCKRETREKSFHIVDVFTFNVV